jgi:hypothetical protein
MSSRSPMDFEWCNAKNRWCWIDVGLAFSFGMGQQAYHLPLLLLRWLRRALSNNMTMPPIDCRMCKTVNRWHSIDAHFNHIETAFVHPIIVRNNLYTHYWHQVLYLYVLWFASRSVITSQFLIRGFPPYSVERWHGPSTFPCFRTAIDVM